MQYIRAAALPPLSFARLRRSQLRVTRVGRASRHGKREVIAVRRVVRAELLGSVALLLLFLLLKLLLLGEGRRGEREWLKASSGARIVSAAGPPREDASSGCAAVEEEGAAAVADDGAKLGRVDVEGGAAAPSMLA